MPITKAEKAAYNDYIKEPKVQIEETKKKIKQIESRKNSSPNIAGYLSLEIVMEYLNNIKTYIYNKIGTL